MPSFEPVFSSSYGMQQESTMNEDNSADLARKQFMDMEAMLIGAA